MVNLPIALFLVASLSPGSLLAAGKSTQPASTAVTKILILGDSLTEGYGIARESAFPALVEASLKAAGKNVSVINGGVSGSTSASGPSRMKWYLKSKPDMLVLALGANDGLRGQSVVEMRKNLAKVMTLARDSRVPQIVLVGMKIPFNYGPVYRKEFEAVFPSLAKEYDVPLLSFLLDGVATEPSLNLADGVHPNEKGHKVVAKTVHDFLMPLL